MSFLFGTPKSAAITPDQRLSNIQPERYDTNEEARPLPYFAGRARLGVTWWSDSLNTKTTPVTSTYKSGKKKTTTSTVGYIYEAMLVGGVCHGPVKRLLEIWIDNRLAWSGSLTRSGSYSTIDISGQASIRFYWGTENQPADGALSGHPAYRGQCYAVFEPLIFGRDRTSAPNVEFVVERETILPGLTNPANSGDVCLVHSMVELLCHPRLGVGMRLGDFNVVNVQAFSDAVTALGIWGSPLVTKATSPLSVVADFLSYFDGYLRQEIDGRYSFASASLAVDYSATPILDTDQLTDHPDYRSPSYASTPSETRLVFTDRDRGLKENTAIFTDTAASEIHGLGAPLRLDRPAITRQSIANFLVTRAGLRAALPAPTLSCMARLSAAAGLQPGDPVRVRPWFGAGFLLNCRVKRRELARSTDRELRLELLVDPAALSTGDVPADYVAPAPLILPPEDLVFPLLRTLPAAFAAGAPGDKAVLLVGARSHGLTIGYDVEFSRDSLSYEYLASLDRFASTGVLTAAWNALGDFVADDTANTIEITAHGLADDDAVAFYPGASGTLPAPLVATATYYVVNATTDDFQLAATPGGAVIDLTTAGLPGGGRLCLPADVEIDMHPVDRLALVAQSAAQADENRLVLFLGDEILSVEGYTAVSGTSMRFTGLRRGRFTTEPVSHASGARAWMLYREDVEALVQASFVTGGTRYFKVPTTTSGDQQDSSLLAPLSLVI